MRNLTQGLTLSGFLTRPRQSLFTRAMDAIRRNDGSLFWLPENFGWVFGPEKITAVDVRGGSFTGGDLIESSADEYHGLSFVNTTVKPAQFKFRARAGTKHWLWARFEGYAGGNAWFNVATGTIGNVESGVAASIKPVGDGYFECVLTNRNAAPAGNCTLFAVTANAAVTPYTGSGSVAVQVLTPSVREIVSAAAYNDYGGVTPVAAVGEPIGRVGERPAFQAMATQRPTAVLNAHGDLALGFDGVDDSLNAAFGTGNAGWLCAAGNGAFGNSGASLTVSNSGATLWVSDGASAESVNAQRSLGAVEAGWGANEMFVAGDLQQSVALKTLNCTNSQSFVIGSRSPSVLTALVVCPGIPPPVDRAEIRRWANSLLRN